MTVEDKLTLSSGATSNVGGSGSGSNKYTVIQKSTIGNPVTVDDLGIDNYNSDTLFRITNAGENYDITIGLESGAVDGSVVKIQTNNGTGDITIVPPGGGSVEGSSSGIILSSLAGKVSYIELYHQENDIYFINMFVETPFTTV